MLLNVVVSIVVISILIMGALVIARNNKLRSSRIFATFCFLVCIWIIANYCGANFKSNVLAPFLVHLDFFIGVWLAYVFYLFTLSFTTLEKENLITKLKLPLLVGSVIISLASISEIFVHLKRNATGLLIIRYTNYYDFYGVFLAFMLIVGILVLTKGFKRANGVYRTRLSLMFWGLAVGVILVAIANLLVPTFTKSETINLVAGNTSYIGIAFFVFMTSYAIIKHKLFDIRVVVARSLAYVFSLSLLALAFALILTPLTRIALPNLLTKNYLQMIYTVEILILAVLFQPLKSFFDRITNKLFYQDAYETQIVLDKVSGVIVGNVDPLKVQKGALEALAEALKPTYIAFLLMNTNEQLSHGNIMGQHADVKNLQLLKTVLKKAGKRIILFDELEERTSNLHEALRSEDISVVSPLLTKDELIGYLILGPKKSGNIYNSQDVGLLNIASNELAVALQNAQRFEEIQAFNITLQEKVTEATRELKRTNRKLIALDDAKDEFISMASHQLRTPLTSIKGYISMMLEGDLGKLNVQQERALKEAFGSSQRMVFLIADFLNVSRIKTGKFVIEPKEVDLPQVVSEEITQLREMAGSRDITLEYEAPGAFPRVMLDENKIRQVMMNMVDNAIYYTPAGGLVTIQLFVDGNDVVFKVKDTGIGVPKREQHKLFTKFFRANNAKKARPDGTGLGLFMAQKIIVEQGGAVIFESAEGKGSTFGFRFPLTKIKQ